MPNVVLEAMASGLPVIATRVSGNDEVVVDGETGLLVPVADVDEMYRAMKTMIEDRSIARRLGQCGLERARRQFSWRTSAEKYLHLAHELATMTP